MPNARFVINKEIVRDLTSYHKKKTNLNVSDDVQEQILFILEGVYRTLFKK